MSKLPLSERPPSKDIEKKLFDRVSKRYRDLFVLDIQNDCACSIETYDSDPECGFVYLSGEDKIKETIYADKIVLPMISNISDKSILLLLQKACENVGTNPPEDILPYTVLTNPKSDKTKLNKVFAKTYGSNPIALHLDFIPVDDFIMVPEPEFFGAISVNIGGFGAFCFPKNLYKCMVD